MTQLWEILVPTIRNDGKPYRTRYHRVWDKKVRDITGGLTILQPAKGIWLHPYDGDIVQERMIPVRIAGTAKQMSDIAAMTIKYYDQHTVMYYRVSDKVVFYRGVENVD